MALLWHHHRHFWPLYILLQALTASDLNIVMYVCEQVDPESVFSQSPCPLSQPVLLSLIQQLSVDLTVNTELKHKWVLIVTSLMLTQEDGKTFSCDRVVTCLFWCDIHLTWLYFGFYKISVQRKETFGGNVFQTFLLSRLWHSVYHLLSFAVLPS